MVWIVRFVRLLGLTPIDIYEMRDRLDQSGGHTCIHWGWTLWGLLPVAPTKLQVPLVCVKARCVVGRIRLGRRISWVVYLMELGTNWETATTSICIG